MPVDGAVKELLSNGVLGLAVLALVYFILMLRAELKDVRAVHRVELAEKDKLIFQLQENRLSEARIGFDVARSNQATLDAFLSAIRGKSPG